MEKERERKVTAGNKVDKGRIKVLEKGVDPEHSGCLGLLWKQRKAGRNRVG